MSAPAIPANETGRLARLHSYAVLDTPAEPSFDDITMLASHICQAPIALVNLIDSERQWTKARQGLDIHELPRQLSFCAHAILQPDRIMEVPDARLDPRFADNPVVTGDQNIRFYAGAPLVTRDGFALGSLCVLDRQPRQLTEAQRQALLALARQVMALLELRQALQEQARQRGLLEAHQLELEDGISRLRSEAQTDALTGIANRRRFDAQLDSEVYCAERYQQAITLMMIDIDAFKSFNDQFGHPAGDGALQQAATLLAEQARKSDLVARYGGEEFAIILPETSLEGGRLLAERTREKIAAAPWPYRLITVSIGIAEWKPGMTASELVRTADQQLYRAKQQGRNRVVG